MSNDKNFIKDLIFTLLKGTGILIIVGGFILFVLMGNMRRSRTSRYPREKACYANMRVLLGAVEMYNMDNTVMVNYMDDKVIDRMVKGKYLRSALRKPDVGCDYLNDGDLAKTGLIYCKVHGTVEGPPHPPPSIWDRIMSVVNRF